MQPHRAAARRLAPGGYVGKRLAPGGYVGKRLASGCYVGEQLAPAAIWGTARSTPHHIAPGASPGAGGRVDARKPAGLRPAA